MTTILPQCFSCKHLEEDAPMHCAAFPEEIPDDIVYNKFDHRKPHEDDHGVRFEALEGMESPFARKDAEESRT